MAQADTQRQETDSDVPGEPAAEGPPPDRAVWSWLGDLLYQMPSWLVSTVVHMGLLIVLALVTLPPAVADKMVNSLVVSSDDQRLGDDLEQLEDETLDHVDLKAMTEDIPDVEEALKAGSKDIQPLESDVRASSPADPSEFGFDTAPKTDPMATVARFGTGSRDDPMAVVGGFGGDALAGRSEAGRKAAVRARGGTPQSEKAVEAALEWLAAHQFPDGGWSFTHQLSPQCMGRCGNPGSFPTARNAATGMALLPFLGAGYTHEKGKYKKVVRAGLYFLTSQQDPQSGSLWDTGGRMYSHGIASIALCEAYAMTRDRSLQAPAQGAVNFICYAQDPIGGGWRYMPQTPGDTSVVGWQLMALKSAHLAYLVVPPLTVKKASAFLDSVQSPSGANYGYLGPSEGVSTEATTAIGLLCRMYLGWKKSEPHLEHGVQWISRRGPNSNLYYDYYATQVMCHWDGDLWKRWNNVMRDSLVNSQSRAGHEAGSWFNLGPGQFDARNLQGGRLYCTALAAMILEVYYRHMPIYAKQSTESGF